jgi:hypothetical protein
MSIRGGTTLGWRIPRRSPISDNDDKLTTLIATNRPVRDPHLAKRVMSADVSNRNLRAMSGYMSLGENRTTEFARIPARISPIPRLNQECRPLNREDLHGSHERSSIESIEHADRCGAKWRLTGIFWIVLLIIPVVALQAFVVAQPPPGRVSCNWRGINGEL